jgi:tRNA U34 2-thiouridine synthase MnmA/TrmU
VTRSRLGTLHVLATRVAAKLRYRSRPFRPPSRASNGGFVLELDEPVARGRHGQVAALYDDDAVLGAGVITRTA